MQSRRDFLKSAAALSGSAFVFGSVPEAIAKALNIDPETGSTFMDAEHVVILMQENRSFDHCFGALQGVRGYRDPRVHIGPNGHPVWFQTDHHGATYAPFRLNIKDTKVTWIGGLPHSWPDQVDARNGGHYDKWLVAKPKQELPFTLGHYTREDVPFYYALADAFTVCDQAFCSSLTGTTPNRLFLWTGNIRKDASDQARVMNEDTDYDKEAAWITFPERLEDAGVSWRIYQNELSIDSGFEGEQDDWLGNFTDNPLEWFSQYNVRFAKSRRAHLDRLSKSLAQTIADKQKTLDLANGAGESRDQLAKEIADAKTQLKNVESERAEWTDSKWESLSTRSQALHEKAFSINDGDPDFRELAKINYHDGESERELQVPKGDTLHRFRNDVETGHLPAVSWIVAPNNFSDHPDSPWYGPWYVSEVLDILTKNPEVWKKTVFILCYDENDGYFDHVPPFVAAMPGRPETGLVSEGIDTSVDVANVHGRENSIGLGFRVPLLVASPWSRGGCVNSQVFDHTSVIQFVETWLAGKGKHVRETNISDWRRTVCGDLTSIFQPYHGEDLQNPKPLSRDEFIEGLHAAKFKQMPQGGKPLASEELTQVNVGLAQEPGTRSSCPLPYELAVDAIRTDQGLNITLRADNKRFGKRAQGAPFNAYAYGDQLSARSYTVKAGGSITDSWPVGDSYHVRIDGPNGFMREFKGRRTDPNVEIRAEHRPNGKVLLSVANHDTTVQKVEVKDESYGAPTQSKPLAPNGKTKIEVDTSQNHGWYDFTVNVGGLAYRYAGRVETGRWSVTDTAMGRSS